MKPKQMKDLVYSHRFASGRKLTLTVTRMAGTCPRAISSIQCSDLTSAELAEYLPWRNQTVASLMSTLTPEEVFASTPIGKRNVVTGEDGEE